MSKNELELVKYQCQLEQLRKDTSNDVVMFKKAAFLSESTVIPDVFRGNKANCFIALEIADRIGAGIMPVMQNLYIVHGKPSFSSSFLIATINQCGRFRPLKYKFVGKEGTDSWGCIAYTSEKDSNEILESETITIKMAKDEGWFGKKGSKWQTMPGQMLRYRSASFWCRAYAPEISMGIITHEEAIDINDESQYVTSKVITENEIKIENEIEKEIEREMPNYIQEEAF